MKLRYVIILLLIILLIVSVRDRSVQTTLNSEGVSSLTKNEKKCIDAGWHKITTTIDGHERQLLYKGPADAWKGSIIVMHGGGGDYTQWCYDSVRLVKPQVDFSNLAVSRGFGVFLLDSTNDVVTDANGRLCGKRFDATVVDGRSTNVDLPYIERVIKEIIPSKRSSGSSPSIFMTGESTGGYMTTRAATHFDNLITAFAPAASGDPYGTYFDCNPALSPRDSAKGAGFDRETNLEIIKPNSCVSTAYPNEYTWETMSPSRKPPFKTFHSADDGVADLSCREKVATQLRAHGYPDDGAYVIPSTGTRSVWAHFWQSAYNNPVLDFFAKYSE
jgi:pimeloyl-ACP methyl ester carboxylesterase